MSTENKSFKKLILFIICYISYVSIYIARLNLTMAAPVFQEMGYLDAAQIGRMGSIFSVVYAAGRLINGGLADKVKPWIMICGGLVICGIASIFAGFLPPFMGMLLLWAANAYSQSMLWSSLLCVISASYDAETARKKVSYLVTTVAVGNILGIIVNTFFINSFGVAFAFVIPGAFCLVCSLFAFQYGQDFSQKGKERTAYSDVQAVRR